jgi:hypothetical protein
MLEIALGFVLVGSFPNFTPQDFVRFITSKRKHTGESIVNHIEFKRYSVYTGSR